MEKKINRGVIRTGETDIKVHLIDSFPNHPYHVFDDEDMTELTASIDANGLLIVCCQTNSIEYYEVECGNHHQSDFNDKCNKLKSITQNLYFITQNKEIAENRLKPQIEKWIASCGKEQLRLTGITVYLTSITDLAMQKWSYVFNMKDDKPICIENETEETIPEQEGDTSNDEFSE